MSGGWGAKIDRLEAEVYRIPTDAPESDGTLEWDHTDLVLVRATAGGAEGIGWTYGPGEAAGIIGSLLQPVVVGTGSAEIEGIWEKMSARLRNAGRRGLGAMALSAVDLALWDLKARRIGAPLVELLGPVRPEIEIYGSGGFTSYDEGRLAEQLAGWVGEGIGRVKMKIGRDPAADPGRVRAARRAIGAPPALFVDANGAYAKKQALEMAERLAGESEVSWFEEPVSSDDLEGLRYLRDRAPAQMEIAAGEYGDYPGYFLEMLQAGAVDCLQADVTRCGGYTGFRKAADLCQAFHLPLSGHCAPQLHLHIGCAAAPMRHIEYFHDHVRIERMLFEGVIEPKGGALRPDRSRPGHGLEFKAAEAARYRTR